MVSSMGMYGMGYSSGNVYQTFKNKYGVGNEDFGTRPYAQPYPMAILPQPQEPAIKETWLARFIRKCYS